MTLLKKIIVLIINLSCSLTVCSQISNFINLNNKPKYFLNSDVNFEINSNSITNQFVNYLYGNSHINNSIKDNVISNLRQNNYFEQNLTINFTYIQNVKKSDNNSSYFYTAVSNHNYNSLSFNPNLMKLLLNGNKQFAGQNIMFDKTYFNSIALQQLQLGYINEKINGDIYQTYSIGVALNKGQNNTTVEIGKAEMFTDADGRYIDFKLNTKYRTSDTANIDLLSTNGFGGSINFLFSYLKRGKYSYMIEVANAGFMFWNTNSVKFNKDTAFRFEGIEVDNILKLGNASLNEINQDSLLNKITNTSYKDNYSTILPFSINASYTNYLNNSNFNFTSGIKLSILPNFKNYYSIIYLEPKYIFNDNNWLALIFTVTGRVAVNMGLNLNINLYKGLYFNIQSNYIDGVLFPDNNTNQNLKFSITKTIK